MNKPDIGGLITRGIQNTTTSQTLASLRDTLLPRLMSGQLRVPEAEQMVHEAGA